MCHIGQNYPSIKATHSHQSKRESFSVYLEEALKNINEKWPITRHGDTGLKLKRFDYGPLHTWFMGLAGYQTGL